MNLSYIESSDVPNMRLLALDVCIRIEKARIKCVFVPLFDNHGSILCRL
jgi:hypothetical protein